MHCETTLYAVVPTAALTLVFNLCFPYLIRFKAGYEPYLLVSRHHMPWYDERFRGYGWDKVRCTNYMMCTPAATPSRHEERRHLLTVYAAPQVMHVWQMDSMGFQFVAHPNAWVVHRPHVPSAGAVPHTAVPSTTANPCLLLSNRN